MQMSAAEQLRKSVTRCPEDKHQWEKEYYNGANTGDYVCLFVVRKLAALVMSNCVKNKLRARNEFGL